MKNSGVSVIGSLKAEIRIINNKSQDKLAEVVLRGTFRYRDTLYSDIWFATLILSGDVDSGYQTSDSFTDLIPYLKPVKAFRKFLEVQLRRIVNAGKYDPFHIVRNGLISYMADLDLFPESQSLIRQAKAEVNRLGGIKKSPTHPGPFSDSEKARQILRILQVTPITDRQFKVARK